MINIHARVIHLIQKYGTGSPEKLAKELRIVIIKRPYKKTMEFFKKEFDKKFIIVNSNLDEFVQRLVLSN